MSEYTIGDPVKAVPPRWLVAGKYQDLIDRLMAMPNGEWLPVSCGKRGTARMLIGSFRKKGIVGSQQFEVRQRGNVVYLRAIRPKGKP